MFISKKIATKIGAIMALAMLGGFSYGATVPMSSLTAEACSMISKPTYGRDYGAMQRGVIEPENVTKLTMYPSNKQYLTSKFPMQKIGTTRTFKTAKSSGTISYTERGIILTERVSRTNPKFTYIKSLPSDVKVADIQKLSSKSRTFGSHGIDYVYYDSCGVDVSSVDKTTYGTTSEVSFFAEYVDKNTVDIVMTFPNQYYNEQKIKANRDAGKEFEKQQKKRDAEMAARAKEQYSIEDSRKNLSDDFPLQTIETSRSFKNENSHGKINYTEDGIYIEETVSKSNPQFTYLKNIDTSRLKNKADGSYGVSETCRTKGLTTYEYDVKGDNVRFKVLIPYDGTYNNGASSKREELKKMMNELNKKQAVLDNQMKELSSKESAVKDSIVDTETRLEELKNKPKATSEQLEKLETLQTQKAKYETSLATYTKKKTSLEKQLKKLQAQLKKETVPEQKAQIQEKIKAVQEQQKTVDAKTISLDKKMASTQKQIANIQAAQKRSMTEAKLKKQSETLNRQLDTLRTEKMALQNQINSVKTEKAHVEFRELGLR